MRPERLTLVATLVTLFGAPPTLGNEPRDAPLAEPAGPTAPPAEVEPALEEPPVPVAPAPPGSMAGLHFGFMLSGGFATGFWVAFPFEVGGVVNFRSNWFDLRGTASFMGLPNLDKALAFGAYACLGIDAQLHFGTRYGVGLGITGGVGGGGGVSSRSAGALSFRVSPVNVWLGARREVELGLFASVWVAPSFLPSFMLGGGLKLSWLL